MNAGKLIVFSGLDASGKTTNRNHVDMRLNSSGIDYAMTREPGGTPFAEAMRELILCNKYDTPPLSEVLMFYAGRVEHTKSLIKPYLERGYHVLSDRYYDSSLAYQSIKCPETKAIHDACFPHLVVPDLTLLFDVPAEVAIERMTRTRGALAMDKIETRGLEYFTQVRNNFLNMADLDPNTIIIDATKPLAEVMDETWQHIKQCIGYHSDDY